MVSKVVTRIVLEGVEDIKAKLASLGVTGEAAMRQIKAAGGTLSSGAFGAGDQLQKLGLRTLEAKSAADAFREAIHIAHPILEEAGLGLGNLGGFARLASVGLGGIVVAAAGAAVIGLAKLGEQAKKTKEQIDQVFGPKEAPAAEDRIKQIAKGLGAAPEQILGPVAQIRDTGALLGRPQLASDQRPEREVTALQQLARTQGATQEEAAKAATDLFGAFHKQALEKPGETPRLTNEILEQLPRGLRNELSKLFGAGPDAARLERQIQGGRTITSDDLLRRLDVRASAIAKEFQERPPEKRTTAEAAAGAAEAVKVRAEVPSAAIDTFGVKASDAIKGYLERPTAPAGERPSGFSSPSTFLLDLLQPTRTKAVAPSTVAALGAPVTPEPAPLPFAAALAARTPAVAGAAVNAAPQIDQLGASASKAAGELNSIKAPAGATVPAAPSAAPAEVPGHAEGGFILAPRLNAGAVIRFKVGGHVSDQAKAKSSGNPISLQPVGYKLGGLVHFDAGGLALVGGPNAKEPTPKDGGCPPGYIPSKDGKRCLVPGSTADTTNKLFGSFRTYAAGGHVLARVSNGEHFFPPKEVAAIGLPTLQAINSLTSGGRIRGPGTGTSDSILASLPAGGFVLNARASGMVGEQALSHLHGFADGGPIEFDHNLNSSRGAPSFDDKHAVSASSDSPSHVVNLHFPDRSFSGLRATSQTAEDLRNYSLGRQVASTGTRPSWVGG